MLSFRNLQRQARSAHALNYTKLLILRRIKREQISDFRVTVFAGKTPAARSPERPESLQKRRICRATGSDLEEAADWRKSTGFLSRALSQDRQSRRDAEQAS